AARQIGGRLLQHASRPVEANRFPRLKPGVQQSRELAGTATQIDDAHAGGGPQEREEIEERLLALAAELVVLSGVPGVLSDCGHWTVNELGSWRIGDLVTW